MIKCGCNEKVCCVYVEKDLFSSLFVLTLSTMRILHILCFLVGVQLIINGVFFSSSLLTATGAALICLFILLATKKSARDHSNHGNGNGHTAHHGDIGPKYHQIASGRETYFAPIALLSLIGGCLAYLFLPIDNVYEKTAITVT